MPEDDVPLWVEVAVLCGFALISFAAGAYEFALSEASRSRLKKRLEKGDVAARDFIDRAVSNDPLISVRTSLLHSLFSGAFIVYGVWVLIPPGPLSFSRYCWTGLAMLVVQAIFRGVAKLVGEYGSENFVVRFGWPMQILTLPMAPIGWLAVASERVFSRAIGLESDDEEEEREAEVIDAVSDGQLDGVVEDGQKEMIEGIFEFKDADVADIFVPRTEMTTIDAGSELSEAVNLALDKGYSRLPAYKGTRDHIVGIFYVRDALKFWDKPVGDYPTLSSVLRPPLFVPETKKIPELLAEMRRGQSHMAVVLDEYGGTAGLVTMEDVLEEIVGDIQDEYDAVDNAPDGEIRAIDETTFVAEGHAHVSDVNKLLGEEIIPEDDDYETVAGFVLDNLGHIPSVGEHFDYAERLDVKVLHADERRVRRVRFKLHEGE
jgi:Hemolysins and related proteins containing CBS domains